MRSATDRYRHTERTGTITKRLPRSLVIATGKGGCGKTTLTANLATLAAARGVERVIAVDLDPQANLGKALGVKGHDGGLSMLSAAMGDPGRTPDLHATGRDNLWYVAGGSHLKRLRSVAMFKGGPFTLATWVRNALGPLADGRTTLYIDTPQASGDLLADAALLAGESVLVPTKLDEFSVRGVSVLVEQLLELHDNGGGDWGLINIAGVVLFAVNRNASSIERRTRQMLRTQLGASRVRLLDASVMATDKAQIDAIMAGLSAAEYAWLARTTELPPWYETLGTDPLKRLTFASNADALAADHEAVAAEVEKALAEDLG